VIDVILWQTIQRKIDIKRVARNSSLGEGG